jgi:ABC-type amino acid transport substrate-binding protein
MIKHVKRASLLLFVGVSAWPAYGDGIIEVNDSDWPPYFFAGDKSKPDGFGKELLKHCFQKTGVRASFRHVGIKRAIKELEDGTLDLNVYSQDARREGFLIFGDAPLFKADYRPFVRADSKAKITKLKDFDSMKLGNLAGLGYTPEFSAYLAAREKTGGVATVNDQELNIRMLVSGKIDTFVNTVPTVLWQAKELGFDGKIKALDFVIKARSYHVAIARKSLRINNSKVFLETLDQCLNATTETSFYKAIAEKYLEM